MENFELKPMTDFVQQQSDAMYEEAKKQIKQTPNYVMRFITVVPNYANFLKQECAIWMFIPCDTEGNVLPKPEIKPETNTLGETDEDFDALELHEYIKAKERCLFLIDNYEIADDVIFFADKTFMISKENGNIYSGKQTFKTIEELANGSITKFYLSEIALKKIGV